MIEATWEGLPLLLLTLSTAVFGIARLTRVITYDSFPPAVWWREKWTEIVRDTDWKLLFSCFWCLPFWITLVCIGWWIGGLYVLWIAWAWWIFWGALAIAYLASMVIVRDGGED